LLGLLLSFDLALGQGFLLVQGVALGQLVALLRELKFIKHLVEVKFGLVENAAVELVVNLLLGEELSPAEETAAFSLPPQVFVIFYY